MKRETKRSRERKENGEKRRQAFRCAAERGGWMKEEGENSVEQGRKNLE